MVEADRSGGTTESEEESGFAFAVESHQHALRVHCYRMLGSFTEAEDLVQETFLRAWKGRSTFAGSSMRAWLYRIATNVCLDYLRGRDRRVLPYDLSAASDPALPRPVRTDVEWLQPLPDSAGGADDAVIARETIELAFIVALQHLRPMQRAVLVMRDVLGWRANEVAEHLDVSVSSVNNTLHRARAVLREELPSRRSEWMTGAALSRSEATLLATFMAAVEAADVSAMAELLAADVRSAMPPWPMWFAGRAAVVAAMATSWKEGSSAYVGRLRMVPTGANRQLAAAAYLQRPGSPDFLPFAITVLGIRRGRIAELTAFHDVTLFAAFGLPGSLSHAG